MSLGNSACLHNLLADKTSNRHHRAESTKCCKAPKRFQAGKRTIPARLNPSESRAGRSVRRKARNASVPKMPPPRPNLVENATMHVVMHPPLCFSGEYQTFE
ncbi:hypothetical protein LZ30DRAFT_107014 [Colletotrichum cereale]|nr:hypothetical protein LZ30DRAFT_107014 [Colletotrichum cereale]